MVVRKLSKIYWWIIGMICFASFATFSFAQTADPTRAVLFPDETPGVSFPTLPQYISHLYTYAIWIATGLALIMVIYGGYKYTTSSGNPDVLTEAKEIIIGALVGLLLLILARVILSTVGIM